MKGPLRMLLVMALAGPAAASHDWFGVDLCRSRPERMPPELRAAELPDPASPGARLLARHCGQCHNLPHPGLHTAAEWREVAEKMFLLSEVTVRFGGRPDLLVPEDPEREAIGTYLAQHALRRLPEGRPAPAVYHEVCGDCHAAPDPALYAADAWPAVFARMAGHRVVMARDPLDPLRATRVLAYLTEHAVHAEDNRTPGRWVALAPVFALAAIGVWLLFTRMRRERPV